jgi:signal transduction histidine kinase
VRLWTLRRRLTVLLAGSTALAIIAFVVGTVSFVNLLDARTEIISRIDPAQVTERDLLASMLDQETAVRGFAFTADESFLVPYVQGVGSADAAIAQLRTLVRDSPSLSASLEESVRVINVWRNDFAEPEIARVRLGGAGEPTEDVFETGRARFDAIRAELEGLEVDLSVARTDARNDLDTATHILIGSLIGTTLVMFGVGVVAWIAFARWTIRPLERLAAGARRVAGGEFHHELEPYGPPEIERLGRDVEAMRRRIADEVSSIDSARTELDSRAIELARSNADLEQFAYVASHDLQEPLRKVTSFCQLLQRRYADQLDERANQYIDFAVDGARRMQTLINDLLMFSRVGRNTERFIRVDLNDIADRAVADLDDLIVESNASVDVERLPLVNGDATLLSMLFRNLIGNAIKFRGEQPPVVTVSAARDDENGAWRFEIGDNGIGIEPEYAEKVFVIFQRLHHRDEYEGTGIGLALVKRIIEFHGGDVWIDTRRAQGAAVFFTIPDVDDVQRRSGG